MYDENKFTVIIICRDGVSEGQFGQVMSEEVAAIRKACLRLDKSGSYQPEITFLVVQKRHHIRLFPTRPENSDDSNKNYNVQAGTIVDSHITHPTNIDFYLVSHASIQVQLIQNYIYIYIYIYSLLKLTEIYID